MITRNYAKTPFRAEASKFVVVRPTVACARSTPTRGVWGYAPPWKSWNLGHSESVSGVIWQIIWPLAGPTYNSQVHNNLNRPRGGTAGYVNTVPAAPIRRETVAALHTRRHTLDSVPHNELLVKLWSFGITGNLLEWFQAYLSCRSQHVTLNCCISDPLPVRSTVRKYFGSSIVLNIHQRYCILYWMLSNNYFYFADDAKCLKTASTPSDSKMTSFACLYGGTFSWNVLYSDLVPNLLASSLTTLSITLKSKFFTVSVTLGF